MLTESEYKRLRDLYDRKQEWVKEQDYLETLPEEFHEITNEITSQIEVYEWMTNPPEDYMAYVDEKDNRITTWMGDELGLYRVTGKHYESVEVGYLDEDENEVIEYENQRVQDIYIIGMNGVVYTGKYYYQNGDYCTMEKSDE